MDKSGGQAWRLPITGIVVHQGSRKVTLEEEGIIEVEGPFPVSVKMENESLVNTNDGTSRDEGQEEIFTVTTEAIQSPTKDSDGQGQRSSCSCQQEIELLKSTVKQLILQAEKQQEMIKKQNRAIIRQRQVVSDMKLSFRNFAISLATCDNNEEEIDGLQEFSETEVTAESTDVDPQLLNRRVTTQDLDNFQDGENGFSVTIVSCTGNCVQTPPVSAFASSSLETCSNEVACNIIGQKTNEEEDQEIVDMDHANFQVDEDDDKDSLYIPDDYDQSEEELGKEMENKEKYQGPSSTSTKSVKRKRHFQCGKCSKCFETKDYLTEHIKRVHIKKESINKCHLCTKVYKDVRKLRHHIQSVHEGIRYKCKYCPGKFNQSSDVRKHEEKVHKGGKPTQQCRICGIHLLSSEQSLSAHMSRMHKPSEFTQKKHEGRFLTGRPVTTRTVVFQCHLCSSSFPEREELHLHLIEVHGIAIVTTLGLEAEK